MSSLSNSEPQKVTLWHHSPTHVFMPNQAYMITASTLYKQHYFRGDERLALLQTVLLEVINDCQWRPEAWAVFSNHYHCVTLSPERVRAKT
jgi:putative transposase